MNIWGRSMYKTQIDQWPESTTGAVRLMCFGLLVALNGSAAAHEMVGPIRQPGVIRAKPQISNDFVGSSFGFVKSLADGVSLEPREIVGDFVAEFWRSVDDGTLFDDISVETWALIDNLVAKNPGIADHI